MITVISGLIYYCLERINNWGLSSGWTIPISIYGEDSFLITKTELAYHIAVQYKNFALVGFSIDIFQTTKFYFIL